MLKFYGLLDGPEWSRCGFALKPVPGMVVAFPTWVPHEVEPVTFGNRFTIVTWFLGPATADVAGEPRE